MQIHVARLLTEEILPVKARDMSTGLRRWFQCRVVVARPPSPPKFNVVAGRAWRLAKLIPLKRTSNMGPGRRNIELGGRGAANGHQRPQTTPAD